ncbi:hypothetical protein ACHAXA_003626 [Cyclostephanos tholiformis]|uniref:Lon N-terminal domain-containing protein n=1 Tax=Cyclostephanos tholiformis TaxID=382380 RepID=A0ABD3SPQ4_9STRA
MASELSRAGLAVALSLTLVASSSSSSFKSSILSFAPSWSYSSSSPRVLARKTTTCRLSSSDDDDDDDDDGVGKVGGKENFEGGERMDVVRMLQRSYYREDHVDVDPATGASSSSSANIAGGARRRRRRPYLDATTGRMCDLPLWRVDWVETPGRRNCLNVHEMRYTHMFETLLSSSRLSSESKTTNKTTTDDHNDDDYEEEDDGPLYFGHLYLPGGSSSARSGERRYRLKTWREELDDADRFDDHATSYTLADPNVKTPRVDRSAVVGCLMQVIDHRRMVDGRLIVLVQGLERFVVDEIIDTRPYAVANVQVLLDEEELPWEKRRDDDGNETFPNQGGVTRKEERSGMTKDDEDACKCLRGRAITASFGYHDYEFDGQKLPGCDMEKNYLTKDDVPWIQISSMLPFARYSDDERCLDMANEMSARVVNDAISTTVRNDHAGESRELPMEKELWNGGILWEPPRIPSAVERHGRDELDCDALEMLLWIALEDFCRGSGFALPEEVRCLMPPEMDYLDFATTAEGRRRSSSLSREYPKHRRQRRLSYLAPALIENLELPMKGMRQVWLNTPSTAARLLGALERYEYLNDKMMGEFE